MFACFLCIINVFCVYMVCGSLSTGLSGGQRVTFDLWQWLSSYCGFQGLNSDHQACMASAFLTDASHLPWVFETESNLVPWASFKLTMSSRLVSNS